jgi:hypothetical protein
MNRIADAPKIPRKKPTRPGTTSIQEFISPLDSVGFVLPFRSIHSINHIPLSQANLINHCVTGGATHDTDNSFVQRSLRTTIGPGAAEPTSTRWATRGQHTMKRGKGDGGT